MIQQMTDKADDYARRDGHCKREPKMTELISTYCVACTKGVITEIIGDFDTTLETREGKGNKIE